jgi:hypothetical protein
MPGAGLTIDTTVARADPVRATAPAATVERTIALLAGLSWLAALIHGTVVPEHWHQYPPYAVCFAVLALLQGAWAVAFFRAPTARLLRWAALLSFAVIAVWAASRTTGMPVGPEPGTPEAVGPRDLAATTVELILGIAGLRLSRDWPASRIPRSFLPFGTAVLIASGVALLVGGHSH